MLSLYLNKNHEIKLRMQIRSLLSTLIIIAFSDQGSGFIAFDCTMPGVNITEIDRAMTDECLNTNENITNSTLNIRLIQLAEKIQVQVKACKVRITRMVRYCGKFSHVSDVRNGYADYILDLHETGCLEAHKIGGLTLPTGLRLSDLPRDTTTTRSVILAGSLTDDGTCGGASYSDQFGSWTDVFVQASVAITLKSYTATAETKMDTIHLGPELVCKFSAAHCLDFELGESYWSVPEDEACNKNKHLLLYSGPAVRYEKYEVDSQQKTVTYLVENKDKVFSLRVTEPYTTCLALAWKTEHPSLIIAPELEGRASFPAITSLSGSTDLLIYVNAKFVYLDRIVGKNLDIIYSRIEKDRCRLDKRTLETQLAIASTNPDEFALLYTGEPGHVASVMGEVIYVSKCPKVEAKVRVVDRCFMELPVTSNNVSRYMLPRTHILTSIGTEITCNPLFRPKYYIHGSWYSSGLQLASVPAPYRISPQQPSKFSHHAPSSLAVGGIYSQSEVASMMKQLMYPSERTAITNILIRGVSGNKPALQGLSMADLIDKGALETIQQGIIEKTWGHLSDFGNLVSACIGIIVVLRILGWLCSIILNGALLWDLFGMSFKLIAAISDTMTNAFVHRKVRNIIPEYTKCPRDTVIKILEDDLPEHTVPKMSVIE